MRAIFFQVPFFTWLPLRGAVYICHTLRYIARGGGRADPEGAGLERKRSQVNSWPVRPACSVLRGLPNLARGDAQTRGNTLPSDSKAHSPRERVDDEGRAAEVRSPSRRRAPHTLGLQVPLPIMSPVETGS